MNHDDIVDMLRSASDDISLEIEYELPEAGEARRPSYNCRACTYSHNVVAFY